jgi:hypothetical protein
MCHAYVNQRKLLKGIRNAERERIGFRKTKEEEKGTTWPGWEWERESDGRRANKREPQPTDSDGKGASAREGKSQVPNVKQKNKRKRQIGQI